jgi:hypothetical protein
MHAAMQTCKSNVYAVNIGYHPLCMSVMQMHVSNTNCWPCRCARVVRYAVNTF